MKTKVWEYYWITGLIMCFLVLYFSWSFHLVLPLQTMSSDLAMMCLQTPLGLQLLSHIGGLCKWSWHFNSTSERKNNTTTSQLLNQMKIEKCDNLLSWLHGTTHNPSHFPENLSWIPQIGKPILTSLSWPSPLHSWCDLREMSWECLICLDAGSRLLKPSGMDSHLCCNIIPMSMSQMQK